MEIYDNSLETYNQKIDKYLNIYVKLNMYFIELTKPNGHASLATVYKNESLYDLYKKAAMHLRVFKVRSLYIITPNNEKILLPFTEIISFNQFLMEQLKDPDNHKMVPIYPTPANIVYRIYVDDGL